MRQEHQELFRRYTATPFTEHYYAHQGGSLRYIKAGNGPAIILLHGANIGLIQWFPNIDALAKKYTVYAVDLPGAGESSPIHDRHDFQKTYLQPMRELICHIGEPYAIVAHSFSPWIALQLSLQNVSFQKIVLSNPVGFFRKVPLKHLPLSSKKIAALLTKFIVKPSLPNMERFLQSVSRKQVDPLFVRAYYATISLGGHPFWFINSLMKHGRLKQELYLSETLNQSPPPSTLLLYGKHDPLVSYKRLLMTTSGIKSIRTKEIPDSGHVPSMENADFFNESVLDFLAPS